LKAINITSGIRQL